MAITTRPTIRTAMQTSSSPPAVPAGSTTDGGAAPFSAVNAITTTHLILIAVLAVIVVIGMIYGARLKRRRTLAQQEEQQRLDDYEEEHTDAPATQGLEAPAATPEPAAPVPAAPLDPARQVPPPATCDSAAPPAALLGASASPAAGPITQLKGLGPKVAARLAELDIVSVGQIAALDDDAADALDAKLGAFQGRIARDRWVEQARFLAAGDRAGFEAVFGRL